jgi:hypothetical protein
MHFVQLLQLIGTSLVPLPVNARSLVRPCLANASKKCIGSLSSPRCPHIELRSASTFFRSCSSCNWAPWHWNHDPALHGLDEWHRPVNCLAPARYTPALLASGSALFEICELPEVMHHIKAPATIISLDGLKARLVLMLTRSAQTKHQHLPSPLYVPRDLFASVSPTRVDCLGEVCMSEARRRHLIDVVVRSARSGTPA